MQYKNTLNILIYLTVPRFFYYLCIYQCKTISIIHSIFNNIINSQWVLTPTQSFLNTMLLGIILMLNIGTCSLFINISH